MTALVAVLATLVFPAPAEHKRARWHELPCDRACRHDARHARRVRRAILRVRRYIAPYRGWLASTRACESHGDYGIATGNGYFGAYQFTLTSWAAVGGRGYPHLAPPLEQDYRAVRLLHVQGPGAWPVCGS